MRKPSSFISSITLVAFLQVQIASVWALPAAIPEQKPAPTLLYLGDDPYTRSLLKLQYDSAGNSLEWQLINNGLVLTSQSHPLPESTESVDSAVVFDGDQIIVAGRTKSQNWFIRALNSQGEFQWQRRGEGRVYDLAFSEDGLQLYVAGESAHSPLFAVFNAVNGVSVFYNPSVPDGSGSVYRQLVVSGQKEAIVAQHREDNGQLRYIKWQARAELKTGHGDWQIAPEFCRDCDRAGVRSIALKGDLRQRRFISVASDGSQLEFAVKSTSTGESLKTQVQPVKSDSSSWDGVLRVNGVKSPDDEVSGEITPKLMLISDNCEIRIKSSHRNNVMVMPFDVCTIEANPAPVRKLLSINNTTTDEPETEDGISEERHFQNLEWLAGSITVIAAIGLIYSGYRFAVHSWQKRSERIERDQRQLKEQRTTRNEFIKKLDVFPTFSSLVVLPDAPGGGSVHSVASLMEVAPNVHQPEPMTTRGRQELQDLFSFINEGESNEVEKGLAQNPGLINMTDSSGTTALHTAASSGNYSMIEMLLIMGGDTEAATEQGYLPLHLAAMSGNAEATELILSWMPQLDPAVIAELYHIAAIHGHLDVLKLLHRKSMDEKIQMSRMAGRQYLTRFRNGVYYATGFGFVRKKALPDGLGTHGSSILHEAAMNNHLAMVEYILEEGLVPVNAEDDTGNTALHIAASNGNYHIVEYLVNEQNCDINVQNNLGYTPLHSAIAKRNLLVVKFLAGQEMIDMTKTTLNGDTPLHFACEYEASGVLVGKGDANARRKDGKTPLHLAAYLGTSMAITNLGLSLKEEATLNLDSKDNEGNTPLHIAVMNGHAEFTAQLLSRHKRPEQALEILNKASKKPLSLTTPDSEVIKVLKSFEAKASNQQVPQSPQAENLQEQHKERVSVTLPSKEPKLHEKAAYGLVEEVVELLTSSKASISDRNSYGATALHVAAKAGQIEVARELIKLGADVNSKRQQDATPLHDAAVSGHDDLVILLIENKSEINNVMSDGSSALHLSSREGHAEVVKKLIEKKASVNVENLEKNTPLHLAAERDQLNAVITLLEHNSRTDLKNASGDTALHLAVREKSIDIVKSILAESCDSIDTQNSHGNTPLHQAAQDGSLELTRLLIRNGASTTFVNKDGKSPLVLAATERHIEVANIIRTAYQSEIRRAKSKIQQTRSTPAEQTAAPQTSQAETASQLPQEPSPPAALRSPREMPMLEPYEPPEPGQASQPE